jgi:hypothetical protein
VCEILRGWHLDLCSPSLTLIVEMNEGVFPDPVKPYKVDDKVTFDRNLELKHGKSVKIFSMDRVSNASFTDVSNSRGQRFMGIKPSSERI